MSGAAAAGAAAAGTVAPSASGAHAPGARAPGAGPSRSAPSGPPTNVYADGQALVNALWALTTSTPSVADLTGTSSVAATLAVPDPTAFKATWETAAKAFAVSATATAAATASVTAEAARKLVVLLRAMGIYSKVVNNAVNKGVSGALVASTAASGAAPTIVPADDAIGNSNPFTSNDIANVLNFTASCYATASSAGSCDGLAGFLKDYVVKKLAKHQKAAGMTDGWKDAVSNVVIGLHNLIQPTANIQLRGSYTDPYPPAVFASGNPFVPPGTLTFGGKRRVRNATRKKSMSRNSRQRGGRKPQKRLSAKRTARRSCRKMRSNRKMRSRRN